MVFALIRHQSIHYRCYQSTPRSRDLGSSCKYQIFQRQILAKQSHSSPVLKNKTKHINRLLSSTANKSFHQDLQPLHLKLIEPPKPDMTHSGVFKESVQHNAVPSSNPIDAYFQSKISEINTKDQFYDFVKQLEHEKKLSRILAYKLSMGQFNLTAFMLRIGFQPASSEGQQALLEFAKCLAKHELRCVIYQFLPIMCNPSTREGQQARIEIAKASARSSDRCISQYIHKFGIDISSVEGKEALVQIALLAVEHDGFGASIDIDNYQLNTFEEGRKALFDIAIIAALQSGGYISSVINRYGIDSSSEEGQRFMINLAKLSSHKNSCYTAEHIENYGIDRSKPEGQQALIEIAKMCAATDGFGITAVGCCISRYIQSFGIPSFCSDWQQVHIEIAKIAAARSKYGICENIQYYNIDPSTSEGHKGLLEIALLEARTEGRHRHGISPYIQHYKIDASTPEGFSALLSIAKLAAQNTNDNISFYIKKYGFDPTSTQGCQALLEIAKLSAQNNTSETCLWIKNYGFDISTPAGHQALTEIAKLAAQLDGNKLSQHIKNFGFDPSTPEGFMSLLETAKISILNNCETSYWIDQYGFDIKTSSGHQALTEIAKLAAEIDAKSISYRIKHYGFDSRSPEGFKALLEIALLAAKQNGSQTARLINFYKFDKKTPEGREALFDIFKVAIAHDPFETIQHLHKFCLEIDLSSIHGKAHLRDICKIIYPAVIDRLKTFSQDSFEEKQWNPLFEFLFSSQNILEAAHTCLDLFATYYNIEKQNFDWILTAIGKTNDEFIQKRLLRWYIQTAFLCLTYPTLIEGFKANQGLMQEISKLPPNLRMALIKEFACIYRNQRCEILQELQQTAGDVKRAQLACLVLANCPSNGISTYKDILEVVKSERMFREGKNQQILLETLVDLRNSSLDRADKIDFLQNLFNFPKETRIQSLRIVNDILSFKEDSYLKGIREFSQLKYTLSMLFKNRFQLQLEGFAELYESTLDKWRKKDALITFAGKLNQLTRDKEQALTLFQKVLTQIFTSTFQKDRYDTVSNPHMAEIEKSSPQIFEKWQSQVELSLSEVDIHTDQPKIDLTDKIIQDLKHALENHHLAGSDQTILYPHITRCIDLHWKNTITIGEEVNTILQQRLAKSKMRQATEDDEKQLKAIILEKKLLDLIKSPKDIKQQVGDLQKNIAINSPFYNDLEDLLTLLQGSSRRSSNYKIIDTDDPNHILLMGTEVQNSCNNVNGHPEQNVCLLGYFLDGKHRLGLVCERDERGAILARSVFRLLVTEEGLPALFQERIYQADANSAYPFLLRALALKKASALGIPLLVKDNNIPGFKTTPYAHKILAKQKPVPFEYVDALRGIQKGPYVIDNVHLVHPNTV